jgi:hypothetical protein
MQRVTVVRDYSMGAWKYEDERIPYVGLLKGRQVVKGIRIDKAARPVIISAIVSFLGPLGIPAAKAGPLANHVYDLASAA